MGHHYTYGKICSYETTILDDPKMPRYNCAIRHKGPGLRDFPFNAIRDDGFPYQEYTSDSYCNGCKKCNGINRYLMNNLVNIETYIDKVLTVTLYGASKDLDKTIKMRIGNKYCITYITEKGLQTVSGTFKELSTNIPDDCTRYMGIYNSISTTAYICMDCSTAGESDKRIIYIASIRYIQELFDDEEEQYSDLSQEEKLNYLYTNITSVITNLNQFMEDYYTAISDSEPEEPQQEEEETTSNQPDEYPPFPPPPHIHHGGPFIIGARPPIPIPPFPPPPFPPKDNKEEETTNTNTFDSDSIIKSLTDIQTVLNTFIKAYIESKTEDKCSCNCCDHCTKPEDNTSTEPTTPTDGDDGVDDDF